MRRTRKPVAAGVLSILAGTVAVGGGIAIILVGGGLTGLQMSTWADLLAGGRLSATLSGATILSPLLLGSLGAILTPSGILSITGGAECIRRRHWKLALAGCLCATAVIPVIGLPAVVLVVLSRGEFQKRGADGNGVRNATNSG
jgi:hypothetical protein